MGKPVWVLVAHAPDWRWMHTREDSPWYPTMRLLRQPRPGDWAAVLKRALDDLAQGRDLGGAKGAAPGGGAPVPAEQ
jgi:hypothetical protein